ncbi:hypothetical protein [Candidatus Accumulibacter sp. ACC012]|uniref:hypothetical protein n=1 Tax=Candidatus Accumulibacter sp. ACC012 TaxID=2823332 RepID=UPI0025C722AC|nr:hypothetical protein [Candidatus Accumulibacter sp. ACC012]
MKRELKPGIHAHCFEAYVFHDTAGKRLATPKVGNLALLVTDLRAIASRGQSTAIAQFYGLLCGGMILTKHVFVGLQRPLLTDGNNGADAEKLVYTRKPECDYLWAGTKHDGDYERIGAPPSSVFTVLVSPNVKHRADFPDVDGWINYWTWVEEDSFLPEAPVDWVDRYEARLWTRT